VSAKKYRAISAIAITTVGANTSVSTLVDVGGIDKLGPPYLTKIDSTAEITSTLKMKPVCFIKKGSGVKEENKTGLQMDAEVYGNSQS